MTQVTTAPASKSEDARGLQAKLYREIGISAVTAALRFTTQPEPPPAPRVMETKAAPRHIGATRAA